MERRSMWGVFRHHPENGNKVICLNQANDGSKPPTTTAILNDQTTYPIVGRDFFTTLGFKVNFRELIEVYGDNLFTKESIPIYYYHPSHRFTVHVAHLGTLRSLIIENRQTIEELINQAKNGKI